METPAHGQTSKSFQVLNRFDGFEVGRCGGVYYIRHPRGLIDWLEDKNGHWQTEIHDVPSYVALHIRDVLYQDVAARRNPK